MKYRRKRPSQSNGSPPWIVTYSDMVTLILVFFILLFSISQIDLQKFRAMSQSFKDRQIFDFYPSAIPMEPSSDKVIDELYMSSEDDEGEEGEGKGEGDSLNQLLREVEQHIQESGLEGVAIATRTERGVVLVLPEQVLFKTGEAEILDDAVPFLERVSSLLKRIPNVVKVEGHTDNRPIQNEKYPSNWELSAARASSVIRYFIDNHQLDPARFIATGYGETRPVAPNDGPENWQKNRRVEIVIMDPAYDDQDDPKN